MARPMPEDAPVTSAIGLRGAWADVGKQYSVVSLEMCARVARRELMVHLGVHSKVKGSGMRIGEIAAESGLSADTLRYYEQEGLLDHRHARRAANGYREYTEAAVERLAQIRQAQSAGFTLREIRDVLAMLDGGRLSPVAIRRLCQAKLTEVTARIASLRAVQRYLRAKVRQLELTDG